MKLSLIIFLIGCLGFTLNRNNIIIVLISIELILLGVNLHFLQSAINYDDIQGQTVAVIVISLAGAESAIGLGLLTAYYRLRGHISPNE